MTDLVSQLVGALEECLDDSHQVLAQMEQMYGMNYRQDRLESQRQVIAAAEAALSEAKAGGWVAVPVGPVAWMNDEGDVELAHKPWMSSVWKPLYALPAPPAQRGEG